MRKIIRLIATNSYNNGLDLPPVQQIICLITETLLVIKIFTLLNLFCIIKIYCEFKGKTKYDTLYANQFYFSRELHKTMMKMDIY